MLAISANAKASATLAIGLRGDEEMKGEARNSAVDP
jgi:hypothetical protein